jgi:hypothetical protein
MVVLAHRDLSLFSPLYFLVLGAILFLVILPSMLWLERRKAARDLAAEERRRAALPPAPSEPARRGSEGTLPYEVQERLARLAGHQPPRGRN